MNPFPAPPRPPEKKGKSGCLIAVMIVGGVVVLGIVGSLIAAAVFFSSEKGRNIASALGKGMEAMQAGIAAPGTDELRALGCSTAAVLKAGDLMEIVEPFFDAGSKEHPEEREKLMVMCRVDLGKPLPSCDEVAKVYVTAVGAAAAPFVVAVQGQGSGKAACSNAYTELGELIGPESL